MSNALPTELRVLVESFQAGRFREAETRANALIAENRHAAFAYNVLGACFAEQQRWREALSPLQDAVRLSPSDGSAHNNLGNVLGEFGRWRDARRCYRRAAAVNPDHPDVLTHLGTAERSLDGLEAACTYLTRALALRRLSPEALNGLGIVWHRRRGMAEAERCFRRAIALRPDDAESHGNRGTSLRGLGMAPPGRGSYRRAIALRADRDDSRLNLGNALVEVDRHDEALREFRIALSLRPDGPQAHNNLGGTWIDYGRFESADRCLRRALALAPSLGDAAFNLALTLLMQGRFAEGWRYYESRWQRENSPARPLSGLPQWTGSREHRDQGIVVFAEQGIGDVLQFCRFLPSLKLRFRRVRLVVFDHLRRLLEANFPGIDVVSANPDEVGFRWHCPVMSLGHALRADASTPAMSPYLRRPAVAPPAARGPRDNGRLQVGLVWRGGDAYRLNAIRSLNLDQLLPLLRRRDVRWMSLQLPRRPDEIAALPPGVVLDDPMDPAQDFAATAALIDTLDLVISVDTSTAHLAAAMAKPVWLLHRPNLDWRWLHGRTDSPWYPALRLFSQPSPGDWPSVVAAVGRALDGFVRRSAHDRVT